MLNNYEEFPYAICTSQGLSSGASESNRRKSKILKIGKEALKSKQMEMGSQIRRKGQLLSVIIFEVFPYFSFLSNAANFS